MYEKSSAYNYKEELLQGIKILDFRFLYDDFYDEITQPKKVNFHHVLWFQRGKTEHWIDFDTISIDEEYTLVFVNKNSVQRFSQQKNIKGKVILFSDDFFSKTKNNHNYLKTNILFNDIQGNFKLEIGEAKYNFLQIFNQLELELSQPKDKFQKDLVKNHLHNFLLQAERVKKNQDFVVYEKDQNLEYALKFKELLETHFITEKSVSFYCKKLGISAKRLNRATIKIFKLSPKSIIINRIVLEAKRKLIHTTENTKEISKLLGFKEPTNFIKFFKKNLNTTPLLFRESTI